MHKPLILGKFFALSKKRFVPSPANGHNLFDVETSITMQVKQVKKMNRQVLQRFVMAYQAGRPVDLVKSAKHEVLSIPISIFNTDSPRCQGQCLPLSHPF